MDALLTWITATATGRDVARLVLLLLGLGMWVNLLLLSAYVKRQAVPLHVMVLVVVGGAAGMGTAHAGFVGNLPAGAVCLAFAAACLIGLLLSVVGTPRSMSQRYCTPIDRARWWAHNVAGPARHTLERASDWMGLEPPRSRGKGKDRR
ncbi:hypothetical protein [uncultured Hydrogenophaga sp.]|uniref:hypothetical protein n=1 Tax=uncultured Hydrogenophaga sp. TaxID=199683 RepID=UPI0025898858|nr:hypothetical protein [uncultured Hydrogenophaga sp.]